MRPDWLRLGLLAGLWALGAGASPQGVREADRLQREADVAVAGRQWDAAYPRYKLLADLFPGTPHGRLGNSRARRMQSWALTPDRSPASDDPVAWIEEIRDFFTWP